jgi:hypothetical protein
MTEPTTVTMYCLRCDKDVQVPFERAPDGSQRRFSPDGRHQVAPDGSVVRLTGGCPNCGATASADSVIGTLGGAELR